MNDDELIQQPDNTRVVKPLVVKPIKRPTWREIASKRLNNASMQSPSMTKPVLKVYTKKYKKENKAKLYIQKEKENRDLTGKVLLGTTLAVPAIAAGQYALSIPAIQYGLGAIAGAHLLGPNGIRKTYNHFKNGEYWNATESAFGDLLDVGMAYNPTSKLIKGGFNFERNYLINKNLNKVFNKGLVSPEQIPLNLGWAPKQTISVVHKSNSPAPLTLWNPYRWDVVNEGAPANGVWFLGRLGTPRTDLTNPGKGVKAAKARLLFADRPYTHEGLLTLEKPMLTVGEVPNRAVAERFADLQGADGLIFNNVYDNGYNHNQVIFSLKLPFKSELDWSPKSWFGDAAKRKLWTLEDEATLASHVPEYNQIEQTAKANGTWLKMEDGSIWQGDPRSWVQLQSKKGYKLYPKEFKTGVPKNLKETIDEYNGDIWATYGETSNIAAPCYAGPDGKIISVSFPKNSKILRLDAKGKDADDLPYKWDLSEYISSDNKLGFNFDQMLFTDDAVQVAKDKGYDVTNIKNVVDAYNNYHDYIPINEIIIHKGTPRKSILGNNGNFNLKSKNIYRSLFPFIGFNIINNKNNE